MNHQGTVILDTERLVLRRFTVADADAAFRNWCSDDAVTRFLTWPTHTDRSVTESVFREWVASYDKPDYYQWAIELKALGEPIGSIAVVRIKEQVNSAEVGYCIGRAWWHQGIMSEALKAVMNFFFDEVGANRVESRHDPRNPHSGMVMKKCGLKYEGTMRSSDRNNQGICDACWYAILKSDR